MSFSNRGGECREILDKQKTIPTEMEGSTFTVSNLGMFGIVEFNSIIKISLILQSIL
jgi:pyruvate dehydrogenase E2 component (dihydrolipoamide acetyltransferase)